MPRKPRTSAQETAQSQGPHHTAHTILADVYAVARELVLVGGQSPTQALKLVGHAATLLFDARGGYEMIAADPDALDYDRTAMWVLRLVPRASAASLEEALGLNADPDAPESGQ